jgi:hypothetical protein
MMLRQRRSRLLVATLAAVLAATLMPGRSRTLEGDGQARSSLLNPDTSPGSWHSRWGDRSRCRRLLREVPVTTVIPAPPRRSLDAAVAIPLLAVHVGLAVGAAMAVGFSVMGLDPCAYTACGDPRWVDIGVPSVNSTRLPAL